MNFEEKLRELAEKASFGKPVRWSVTNVEDNEDAEDDSEWAFRAGFGAHWYPHEDLDVMHYISHCDPETMRLVTDVVQAARSIDRDGGLNSLGLTYGLRDKIAALDAHHAKRETD